MHDFDENKLIEMCKLQNNAKNTEHTGKLSWKATDTVLQFSA